MENRATVTGATGFIGRRLVPHLVERGYYVTVIARKSSDVAGLPEGVRVLRIELSKTNELYREIGETDYFFHLAGVTKARERMLEINRDLVIALGEMCRGFSGFRRFIFLSSQAASRPGREPICEGDSCDPVSLYGKSKMEAETALANVDIPYTILRPPSVYGPGDRDIFFYFQLAHRGFVPVVGDRGRLFSFIHVDDLVRGIVDMAENDDAQGRTLFISNKEPVSWGDFAEKMQKTAGIVKVRSPVRIPIPFFVMQIAAFFNTVFGRITGSPPLLSFDKVREMKHSWVCDSNEIRLLGFQEQISLEQGLLSTYRWYVKMGWLR